MKYLAYSLVAYCSSLWSVPPWKCRIETTIKGETYSTVKEVTQQYRCEDQTQSVTTLMSPVAPHFFGTIACSPLENDKVIYLVEVSQDASLEMNTAQHEIVAKGSVVAPIGQDATLTISTEQGAFTFTFSAKI